MLTQDSLKSKEVAKQGNHTADGCPKTSRLRLGKSKALGRLRAVYATAQSYLQHSQGEGNAHWSLVVACSAKKSATVSGVITSTLFDIFYSYTLTIILF